MYKAWNYTVKGYTVTVQQLNGNWLASIGLNLNLDSSQTSVKQEVFTSVRDALHYVGYPDFLPIPKELI